MRKQERKRNWLYSGFLWLLSLLVIYPLAMVLLTSLKEKREANALNIALPRQWLWENYVQVLQSGRIMRSFFNSVFISAITVLLVLTTAALLSYAIERRNTRVCRIIDRFLTFGIIAPFAAMPSMRLLQTIGIYGSLWGLIFTYSALYLPFSTMMITSYIKGIPRELDEAGSSTGRSEWRCLCALWRRCFSLSRLRWACWFSCGVGTNCRSPYTCSIPLAIIRFLFRSMIFTARIATAGIWYART